MKRPPDLREVVLLWGPPVLFAGTLYLLSSRPIPGWVPEFRFSDKLVHAAAYMVLGALLARAFQGSRAIDVAWEARWRLGAWAGFLYGLTDEAHQSFVPGRTSSVWDAAADGLGAFLGAYAVWMVARRLRRTRP